MNEEEFRNRPSDFFISRGLVYKVSDSGSYNAVTRTCIVETENGYHPISISLISKFINRVDNPEYFL